MPHANSASPAEGLRRGTTRGRPGSVEELNRLGSFLGALSQSNNDQGPDVAPIASDLRAAASLGERVARAAQQFAHRRERKVA